MFIYKVIIFDDDLNTNIISFGEDLNEKARIEYETSKYPGTDVNSYFVIGG